MLTVLFWIAIGAFIGWNFPQPPWAKAVQETLMAKWNDFKVRRASK